MDRGEINRKFSPDTILDALYGPLYYRLLIGRDKLTDDYVEVILNMVFPALQP